MDKKHFSLRIDKEIFEKLKAVSADSGRSVNSQINMLIKKYILEYEKDSSIAETGISRNVHTAT
ncbi:MAG: Arc family DNA-binding protein [Oscillospiraceae bacterium]|nr:Arc family DNA-binding protein [Clostridia bacterium]MBQ6895965.1 Arc family DNA-binding protein [Oscillospiraceae bacterium]